MSFYNCIDNSRVGNPDMVFGIMPHVDHFEEIKLCQIFHGVVCPS